MAGFDLIAGIHGSLPTLRLLPFPQRLCADGLRIIPRLESRVPLRPGLGRKARAPGEAEGTRGEGVNRAALHPGLTMGRVGARCGGGLRTQGQLSLPGGSWTQGCPGPQGPQLAVNEGAHRVCPGRWYERQYWPVLPDSLPLPQLVPIRARLAPERSELVRQMRKPDPPAAHPTFQPWEQASSSSCLLSPAGTSLSRALEGGRGLLGRGDQTWLFHQENHLQRPHCTAWLPGCWGLERGWGDPPCSRAKH